MKLCFGQNLNAPEVIVRMLGDQSKENTYWKGFNGPDNFTVLWNPFDTSHSGFKLGRVGVVGNWDVNLHVVGRGSPLELALGLRMGKHR